MIPLGGVILLTGIGVSLLVAVLTALHFKTQYELVEKVWVDPTPQEFQSVEDIPINDHEVAYERILKQRRNRQ